MNEWTVNGYKVPLVFPQVKYARVDNNISELIEIKAKKGDILYSNGVVMDAVEYVVVTPESVIKFKEALATICIAVNANSGDTLSSLDPDSMIIFEGGGHWYTAPAVTLGHLRAISNFMQQYKETE